MAQEANPMLDALLTASAEGGNKSKSKAPQRIILTHSKDWWSIATEFILIGGSLAAIGYMFSQLISKDSPETTQKQVAESMKAKLIARMKKSGRDIRSFTTNSYEDSLLDMIVLPQQIEVRFNDIGGLDNIKRDLTETVLVPLMYPQLTCSSRLCQPPLGVLFYGPPGTGKSMMAKAIARETNATFINVDMSRLMSKWYGDSQKYISALFSLARKMAPSIIWIDEIDALFSQRSRNDHSADVYNKALFLSLWDGLANDIFQSNNGNKNGKNGNKSGSEMNKKQNKRKRSTTPMGPNNNGNDDNSIMTRRARMVINNGGVGGGQRTAGVMVLGATNRPQEVDEAFLRRMSRQYEYTMPDEKTRELILRILLQYENCHENVNIKRIAQLTDNYSGSDLKELCKYAATLPLREYIRNKTHHLDENNNNNNNNQNGNTPDGGWMSKITESIERRERSVNTEISNECSEIFKELGSGNVLQSNEKIHLRSITMKDFESALHHIKSTMHSHSQHQKKYSKGSLYSNLFDAANSSIFSPFAAAAAAAGSGYAGSRKSKYTGPPTVSSRDNNNNNNNNNNGNKNNGNRNKNKNKFYNNSNENGIYVMGNGNVENENENENEDNIAGGEDANSLIDNIDVDVD